MRSRTFIAVMIAVALLVIAALYMHRPRSGSSTRSLSLHGGR